MAAAREAARGDKRVGFLLQRDPQKNEVAAEDLYWVGTAGQIVRLASAGEGVHHIVVQGQERFRVLEFLEGWPFLVARVAMVETPEPDADARDPELEARFLQLKEQATEAIHLLPNAPEELVGVVKSIDSPGQLCDMVANLLDVKNEDKQEVLDASISASLGPFP